MKHLNTNRGNAYHTRWLAIALLACHFVIAAPPTIAQESIASVFDGNRLVFQLRSGSAVTSLTISGPETWIRKSFETGEVPFFSPYDDMGSALSNGVYKFELRIVPDEDSMPSMGNRRVNQTATVRPPLSGVFQVINGTVFYAEPKPLPAQERRRRQ